MKILLAEDNPVNQKLALHQLKRLGYRADVAMTGRAVLELLQTNTYDLILMDCQMPEMDGFEATRQLKQQLAAQAPIVIAMTANAYDEDRQQCLASGMDDYLSKPVSMEELQRKLAYWQERRSQDQPRLLPHGSGDPHSPSTLNRSLSSLVNWERLQALAGDDPDFPNELISAFVENGIQQIAQLHQAIQSQNAPAIARIAHSLKGSSHNLGAAGFIAAVQRLEDLVTAPALVWQETQSLVTVVTEIEKLLLRLQQEWGAHTLHQVSTHSGQKPNRQSKPQ